MSSVVQFTERHPVLTRILARIALSRIFMRLVIGPLMTVSRYVQAGGAAFGPKPRFEIPPGSMFPPEWPQAERMNSMVALIMARVHEEHKGPAHTGTITEKDRAVVQSMTWGTAGAAVLIVVAIATSSKTFSGPAISIAAGCFAVAIPLLVVFGFAFAHHWDALRAPPTAQEIGNLNTLIVMAQFIFAIGLASLLWNFDVRVSIAFLIACLLGRRAFRNLVAYRVAPRTAEEITKAMLSAKNSTAGNQAATGNQSGAA